MSNTNAVETLVKVISACAEAIEASGARGVPEGELYALLMPTGCTLGHFQQIVSILVGSGRVKKQGHLLLAA